MSDHQEDAWMAGHRLQIVLIGLAISVRVAAVLVLQSHHVPNSTYEHGTIAANLLAGRGFSTRFLGAEGPTSQQAPVYPFVVAAAYAIGGVGSSNSLLLLELSQALLGGLLVVGVLALIREIAPHRPWLGPTAALVAAIHPTLVYATTHVQVASLATCLLVWTLALAYRTGRTAQLSDAGMAGISLALLALTDPILALVAPGMAWAIALREGWKRAIRPIATIAIVAALGILPWTVRNYLVHHEFVAIKSSFGYAFWQGNCALSQGTDKVVRASVEKIVNRPVDDLQSWNDSLWAARHEAGYIDDIALTQADYQTLGTLSEPARSRLLYRRAQADLKAKPGRYLQLCLSRLRAFMLFDETNPKTRSLVYRIPHLGLSIFALVGLLLMPHKLRTRLAPTILTTLFITIFHTSTIVSARFHIPIEPLMGLWGVAGLARFQTIPPATSKAQGVGGMHHRLGVARELPVGI